MRRTAARRGLDLHKIRRVDDQALDFGRWNLDDPRRGVSLQAITLAEVEAYLFGPPPTA